ncbi:MAG: DUF4900 domain-containing protein [Bacteroidetes bacterium]|nr:DUF4900 domain-containing protein [Bacteroidota bacterium]
MMGRGALILVAGFGFILGYITINMSRTSSSAVEGMVGYTQLVSAREAAQAGIQIGLAMLNDRSLLKNSNGGTLVDLTPKTGSFVGTRITVRLSDEIVATEKGPNRYYRTLTSVSSCSLNVRDVDSNLVHINDTVKVRLEVKKVYLGDTTYYETYENKFSTLGWMTITEGSNIWFSTGDTLYGKVHSNGDIRVNGRPIFHDRVTTSGVMVFQNYKKQDSTAVFKKGYEERVSVKEFPTDLSRLSKNKVNKDTVSALYVVLHPGSSNNADNDGFAVVYKVTGYDNNGTPKLTTNKNEIDTIMTRDTGKTVIYSRENIFVRGTLDGRLSIASNKNIYIEDDITYEKRPDNNGLYNGKKTDDVLGLIAESNVIIASHKNTANNNSLYLDACIFTRTGSFMAEDYNTRGIDGRIYALGSFAQYQRGPVGTFNPTTGAITSGFNKSYRYDKRLEDSSFAPPFYPGYYDVNKIVEGKYYINFRIVNWWESVGNNRPYQF